MSTQKNTKKKEVWNIGQDWASVAVGFALIVFVVLAGYSVHVPTFGGKTGWNDYTGIVNVFQSSSLFISLGSTLLIFGIVSALGIFLSGDSLKNYLTGFLTVCLLAFSAQFLSS